MTQHLLLLLPKRRGARRALHQVASLIGASSCRAQVSSLAAKGIRVAGFGQPGLTLLPVAIFVAFLVLTVFVRALLDTTINTGVVVGGKASALNQGVIGAGTRLGW